LMAVAALIALRIGNTRAAAPLVLAGGEPVLEPAGGEPVLEPADGERG